MTRHGLPQTNIGIGCHNTKKKWTAIEKVLRDSALICYARDEERAAASAEFLMTGDVVQCNFGFYFFDRLLSKDVHENIHKLFDDIEAFCRAVEQECVQSPGLRGTLRNIQTAHLLSDGSRMHHD